MSKKPSQNHSENTVNNNNHVTWGTVTHFKATVGQSASFDKRPVASQTKQTLPSKPKKSAKDNLARFNQLIELNRTIVLSIYSQSPMADKIDVMSPQPFLRYGVKASRAMLFGNGAYLKKAYQKLRNANLTTEQVDRLIVGASEQESDYFRSFCEINGLPHFYSVNRPDGVTELPKP